MAGIRMKKNLISKREKEFLPFLIPAFIIFTIFLVYPIISSFVYSFTNLSGNRMGQMDFVGLNNFVNLFKDRRFFTSLKNTMVFTLIQILVLNGFGFLLALALDSRIKTKNILRTIFFIPFILSPLIIAFAWSYILGYNGLINTLLGSIGLESLKSEWLGSAKYTIIYLSLVKAWAIISYSTIIYLAALQGIPQSILESSRIDGAHGFTYLRKIVIPMIMHAVTINVILSTINGLRAFDIVFIMTDGGPGYYTETLTVEMYHEAFKSWNFAYGATIGFVLFLFILAVTIVQVRMIRKREVQL